MSFSKRSNTIHKVQEILGILDVGVTVPLRCRFDDGIIAVVKYLKNRSGIRALINEWIGSSIADCIGLNIPLYGLCSLSEDVITNSTDWNLDNEITTDNAGLAFYSQNISNTVCPDPYLLTKAVNKETEILILFDLVINNQDRHKGNILVEMNSKPLIYFIDNSHCLSPVMDFEHFNCGNKEMYDLLTATVGFNEKRLFEETVRIQATLNKDVLEDIRESIPPVWNEKIPISDMNQIFKGIQDRISVLDKLSQEVVSFRRN